MNSHAGDICDFLVPADKTINHQDIVKRTTLIKEGGSQTMKAKVGKGEEWLSAHEMMVDKLLIHADH